MTYQEDLRLAEYQAIRSAIDARFRQKYQLTIAYVTLFLVVCGYVLDSSSSEAARPTFLYAMLMLPVVLGNFLIYTIDFQIHVFSTYVIVRFERDGPLLESSLYERRRRGGGGPEGAGRRLRKLASRHMIPGFCSFVALLVIVSDWEELEMPWVVVLGWATCTIVVFFAVLRAIRCYAVESTDLQLTEWKKAFGEIRKWPTPDS